MGETILSNSCACACGHPTIKSDPAIMDEENMSCTCTYGCALMGARTWHALAWDMYLGLCTSVWAAPRYRGATASPQAMAASAGCPMLACTGCTYGPSCVHVHDSR